MLQLFDSIRKRKARIAVMIVAALVCSLLGGFTAAPMAKAEETGEEIYTPDRVDLIAPVEGAVFLEEKDVLTGLEVTETTTDSITVAWDEMPGMTSYLVYYYDFEKSIRGKTEKPVMNFISQCVPIVSQAENRATLQNRFTRLPGRKHLRHFQS